jgi:nicotinate-nucleotide adenylyltransferase
VFGGTFDPVHNTHLAIAQAALTEARLDLVLFVVSAQPPHKNEGPYAAAEDRYEMVVAATAQEQRFEASRLELERPGPSYTVDTLGLIAKAHPGATLFLIIGMDSLADLPGWRDPEDIVARAHLLVVPRPGHWTPPTALKDRYTVLPFEENDIASTEIRRRIAAGEPIDHLVPLPVQQLIDDRGIYDTCISDGPCR